MSISNQLLDIAQNISKIHEAGQLAILDDSEYMHPTVSDVIISVNDVNALEHKLNVDVKSKNLLNINPMLSAENWRVDSSLNVSGCWNYPITGLSPNTVYTLSMKENGWNGVSNNGLYVTLRNDVGVFAEKGGLCHTTGNWYYCNSKVTITSNEYGLLYLSFYNPTDERLALFFSKCPEMILELGTTATEYTPYVADLNGVEVSRYGKNLLNGKLRENPETRDGLTIQYLADEDCYLFNGTTTSAAAYYNLTHAKKLESSNLTLTTQYVSGEYSNPNNEAAVFYVSCRETINSSDVNWVNVKILYENHSVSSIYPMPYWGRSWFYIGPNVTFNNYKIKVQVEEGLQATKYEKADFQTATTNADGIAEGLTSLSPNMTLITDTNGVIINCEYYRDIDTYIDNLTSAVALTGGV